MEMLALVRKNRSNVGTQLGNLESGPSFFHLPIKQSIVLLGRISGHPILWKHHWFEIERPTLLYFECGSQQEVLLVGCLLKKKQG
jgi:hypothetical protein